MNIGTFRRNLMKTVAPKPAKLGLRVVSKNTGRTNVASTTMAFKRDMGNVVRDASHYLLGVQKIDQEMKDLMTVSMGNAGSDLLILCRILKVKTPTPTKKSKLIGTFGAAILQLDAISTDMLAVVENGVFSGPKMTTIKKMVVMPNKGGIKEERDVLTVDVAAETTAQAERDAKTKALLAQAVELYWKICFTFFGYAPQALFEAKAARLGVEFPTVGFDPEPAVVAKTPKAPAVAGAKKEKKVKAKASTETPQAVVA